MTKTFQESLAEHDAAQDKIVHELRARGYAIVVPPYDAGDTYRPDFNLAGTAWWFDVKLFHTIDARELLHHVEMIKSGKRVFYVMGCKEAVAPCLVACGPYLLTDEWTEPVKLGRKDDGGRKLRHGYACRSLKEVFP